MDNLDYLLPAPIAWVRLPTGADEPIDLPGCRVHPHHMVKDGTLYILVEQDQLDWINKDETIPTVVPIWEISAPIVRWKNFGD